MENEKGKEENGQGTLKLWRKWKSGHRKRVYMAPSQVSRANAYEREEKKEVEGRREEGRGEEEMGKGRKGRGRGEGQKQKQPWEGG